MTLLKARHLAVFTRCVFGSGGYDVAGHLAPEGAQASAFTVPQFGSLLPV